MERQSDHASSQKCVSFSTKKIKNLKTVAIQIKIAEMLQVNCWQQELCYKVRLITLKNRCSSF
jgi:hypothetical protein